MRKKGEKTLITRNHYRFYRYQRIKNFVKNYSNKFDDLRIYTYSKALLSPHTITKS